MKRIALFIAALLAISVALPAAHAAQRPNERHVKELLKRIEKGSDRFRESVDDALDRSRLDGTDREDNINDFVRDFENAADRLRNRRNDIQAVEEVLRRAASIDGLLRRRSLGPRVQRDWQALDGDIDRLRALYGLSRISDRGRGDSRRNDRDRDRGDRDQVGAVLGRIENGADDFRRSLNSALDRSRLDDRRAEDRINGYVRDFERATDRLKSRYRKDRVEPQDAEEVLKRGRAIDGFMRSNRLSSETERDWRSLRGDLSWLAAIYRLSDRW